MTRSVSVELVGLTARVVRARLPAGDATTCWGVIPCMMTRRISIGEDTLHCLPLLVLHDESVRWPTRRRTMGFA